MNCNDYQNRLLESFGEKILPEDLEKHLKECKDCITFRDELTTISGNIGSDELFRLGDIEVERMAEKIDSRIDRIELEKETKAIPMWKYFVPVAAAIFLVLGIASVGNFIQMFDDGSEVATKNIIDDSIFVIIGNNDIEDYSGISIDDLILDYTSQDNFISDAILTEDLTEEKYQYLEENFDIGEIL